MKILQVSQFTENRSSQEDDLQNKCICRINYQQINWKYRKYSNSITKFQDFVCTGFLRFTFQKPWRYYQIFWSCKPKINNLSSYLEVHKNGSILIYRLHFIFKAMENPILNKSKQFNLRQVHFTLGVLLFMFIYFHNSKKNKKYIPLVFIFGNC